MEEPEKAIIDAFQMMWGNYHEPVRLIHRSLHVLAGNAAYLNMGGQTGGRCNTGNPELHRGCQAMRCLKERITTCKSIDMDGVQWDSYWVPVNGCEDYFVHFTNGMNVYLEMKAATA